MNRELSYFLEFTRVYRSIDPQRRGAREAACLRVQLPHILQPVGDELIAGFMVHGCVGFSPQYGGTYTYYYHPERVEAALGQEPFPTPSELSEIKIAQGFWLEEQTAAKHRLRFRALGGPEFPTSFREPGFANADVRVAGSTVNLGKLLRLGIPGLRAEVRAVAPVDAQAREFLDAIEASLDLLAWACEWYARDCRAQGKLEMAAVLDNLAGKAPTTFREALQLFWLYGIVSDLMNYGRLDDALGDFYVRDLEAGLLTEEEALALLGSVWRTMARIGKIHDARVVVGGAGRHHPKNADRLALLILETSRRAHDVVPQLTLRHHPDNDPSLMSKAMNMLSEGFCYPLLYSDQTNIPAIATAYHVSEAEASRYVPFGCGEYILEGLSTGSPNNGVNLLLALEQTLHGDLQGIKTFDDLFERYARTLEAPLTWLARHKRLNYDVAGEEADFLFLSLLTDDCLARGRGLLSGGVQYLFASSEIFGMISCADSLSALRQLVFEAKTHTLAEVVGLLDRNFDGDPRIRKPFLRAPKYGNDDPQADTMAQRVYEHVARATIAAGREAGLDAYLMVSVNNSMSAEWGQYCGASACGRLRGSPLANANGASLGADTNGLTALLNSMAGFDHTLHAGVINNVRLSKELFRSSLTKVQAVFEAFLGNNGSQVNLSSVGADDLQAALENPENYANLIVRIGGFSARFVELSPVVQQEIVARTTYLA
ncbi:MAG: pyruvate formate lyase family protein [Spirochaetales bacterium]